MNTNYYMIIWNEISRRLSDQRTIIDSELDISTTNDNSNNNICFLFYIDETRTFVLSINKYKFSSFRLFRKTLKNIRWHGFFTLLLNILSKISNFIPLKSIDPSYHDIKDLSLELFHPYF